MPALLPSPTRQQQHLLPNRLPGVSLGNDGAVHDRQVQLGMAESLSSSATSSLCIGANSAAFTYRSCCQAMLKARGGSMSKFALCCATLLFPLCALTLVLPPAPV